MTQVSKFEMVGLSSELRRFPSVCVRVQVCFARLAVHYPAVSERSDSSRHDDPLNTVPLLPLLILTVQRGEIWLHLINIKFYGQVLKRVRMMCEHFIIPDTSLSMELFLCKGRCSTWFEWKAEKDAARCKNILLKVSAIVPSSDCMWSTEGSMAETSSLH